MLGKHISFHILYQDVPKIVFSIIQNGLASSPDISITDVLNIKYTKKQALAPAS